MNANDLLEVAQRSAREIVEGGEEHHTIMLVGTPDGTHILRVLLTDHNKPLFVPAITHYLRSQGACAYVFINEAWMVRTHQGSSLSNRIINGEIRIVDLPPDDKEEIIQIVAHQRGQAPRLFSATIQNTPQGRKLGDFKELVSDQISGRMIIKEW